MIRYGVLASNGTIVMKSGESFRFAYLSMILERRYFHWGNLDFVITVTTVHLLTFSTDISDTPPIALFSLFCIFLSYSFLIPILLPCFFLFPLLFSFLRYFPFFFSLCPMLEESIYLVKIFPSVYLFLERRFFLQLKRVCSRKSKHAKGIPKENLFFFSFALIFNLIVCFSLVFSSRSDSPPTFF